MAGSHRGGTEQCQPKEQQSTKGSQKDGKDGEGVNTTPYLRTFRTSAHVNFSRVAQDLSHLVNSLRPSGFKDCFSVSLHVVELNSLRMIFR